MDEDTDALITALAEVLEAIERAARICAAQRCRLVITGSDPGRTIEARRGYGRAIEGYRVVRSGDGTLMAGGSFRPPR